jgi:hypothetical protein
MQPVQPVDNPPVDNPFALLLNPADVIAQVERSERLRRLQSRVCRPLDKPLIPVATEADFDTEDAEPDHGFA